MFKLVKWAYELGWKHGYNAGKENERQQLRDAKLFDKILKDFDKPPKPIKQKSKEQ